MRYHTTFKDIAVSILVVLACSGICLYGMLFFSVINPAQPFADFLVANLDRGSSLSFRASSLTRSFFKEVELKGFSITLDEKSPVVSDTLIMDRGIGQLVYSFFGKGKKFTFTLEQPTVDISLADLESLGGGLEPKSSELLSNWLARNSLGFAANSLNAKLSGPSFTASIHQADLSLSLASELALESFKGSIESAKAQFGQGLLQLDTINLNINSDLEVQAEADTGMLAFAGATAQYEQLALASQLSSLDISQGELGIDFSLANLTVLHPVLEASIPKLSSRLTLDSLAFSTLEASYDQLELISGEYVLQAPTSTFNLTQDEGSLLLGFATKEGSPLTLQNEALASLQTDTLIGSAQLEEGGKLYARLSLHNVQTNLADIFINLDQIQLLSEASLAPEGIENVSLSLESMASVVFGDADIHLRSPLSASLNLSDDFTTLSSSLSLPSLTSDLVEEPFSGLLAYQQNLQGGQLQASLSHKNQLLLNALYNLPKDEKGTFSILGRMQDFTIGLARPTLERYAPFLKPFYSDTTRLTGNLSFQSTQGTGTILGFDGTFSSDLVLLNASLGNRNLNAGFTVLAGIEGDSVVVDSLNLSTADLRLAYSGSTELNYWLPSGNLQLFDTEKGALLISANFSPLPPNKYRYDITTPFVPSLTLEGVIAREGLKNLIGTADFSVYGQAYPLDFTFLLPSLQIEVTSQENLLLQAYLAPPYRANIVAKKLALPRIGLLRGSSLDGHLILQFNKANDWKIEATDFNLDSLFFQETEYSLGGSVFVFPSSLTTSNLKLNQGSSQFDIEAMYKGSELLETYRAEGLAPFSFTFVLAEENVPKISLALTGSSERVETLFEIRQVGLQRFNSLLSGVSLDLTAYGYTNFKNMVSMDGKLGLEGPLFSFSSDLSATDTQWKIEHGLYEQGTFVFKDIELSLDAKEGILLSRGRINHSRILSYTVQNSQAILSLSIPFMSPGSLFDMQRVIRDLPSNGLSGNITIEDLLIFSEKGIADGSYSFKYKDGKATVSSSLLSLSYDAHDGMVKANVDKDFGIGIDLEGWIRPDELNLKAENIYFPLTLLNRLFVKPIFSFKDGIAQGEVILGGTLAKPKAYGQLSLDSSSMELFWLPNDILSVRGATVTIDGSRATSPTIPFFSTNRETGVTVRGLVRARADFDGLNLRSYEIDARSTEGQVFLFIPILSIDTEIQSYAEGTFNLFGIGMQIWLSGVATMENAIISLGLRDLPPWYVPTGKTSTDFTLTTGKNVSFYYPNPTNPFLKATLTENQSIDILYDHTTGDIALDGTFAFRSGEIYYFQKNFFITEGSLGLHTDALSGFSTIQPRINLRAKLTDFDRQGNRVDIFLILRDSSLNNLNPQFESIPNKDINEILEIMGQSILPTGAYGEVNLYSVVSLAAAATDVAGKLGYLNTTNNGGLTESIRISLGLDLFSLRSNIVQNILFDALPGSSLSTSFSPLARYLNNTTIFMGKYIGKDYFLQALIHLSATDRSKIKRSFVAPDLAINLELSMEWTNPLARISFFTQPNELSIYNIFDTIGFSVTKRIVLR
ncbi:MAG: hypothetical protein JEY71_00470 [Sphaerochaeta sp.]|nr:hypothetical protein [Sphaerochaeta sp.]